MLNFVEVVELFDGLSVGVVIVVVCVCDVVVVVGLIENDGGCFYNMIVFVMLNGIVLCYCKMYLWVGEYGVVLFGDCYVMVEWCGVWIGLLICYDSEFLEIGCVFVVFGV